MFHNIKYFVNFKEAHKHYKYPSSYRIGTIYNEKGVIRSYSNNTYDIITNDYFLYKLKNNTVKEAFIINKKSKTPLRLFIKINNGVLDLGLFVVKSFYKGFVKLIKI